MTVVLCAAAAVALPAQTLTTLHSFDSSDGASPEATLVQGTDGNLYGTTDGGGLNFEGTVFKIAPSGALTTVYSFCPLGNGCADGANPGAGLVQGIDGNFYGTSFSGGYLDLGTAFRLSPKGVFTILHTFCRGFACLDGANPAATLAGGDAPPGGITLAVFGTTADGGAYGAGTVFKLTSSGILSTIHAFCSIGNCTDGENPYGRLVKGTDSTMYGTTLSGGTDGDGTVFKVLNEEQLSTLHSFNGTDGSGPLSGLVIGSDGNLYGTTTGGGENNAGTVFKLTPAGVLTTLYSFCSQSNCADGNSAQTGMVQATDGNFYGVTLNGGTNCVSGGGCGAIFQITPGGAFSTIYSFCAQSGCADGSYPDGTLVQDTDGRLYGTTAGGGASNEGTVFSLDMGLGPFVITEPAEARVGDTVKILGTNLAGATGVRFNGTAAAFKIVSNSLITATVPAGATGGAVRVATPRGILVGNAPFLVLGSEMK